MYCNYRGSKYLGPQAIVPFGEVYYTLSLSRSVPYLCILPGPFHGKRSVITQVNRCYYLLADTLPVPIGTLAWF